MPRRRMIDPSLWDDHHIGTLSRDERLFLIGCIGNADDEGRLKGHPAYLKAAIFMYDDDLPSKQVTEIKRACLDKMSTWPKSHSLLLAAYQNGNEEYLWFPNWYETEKPSHPSKSKFPIPLQAPPESLTTISGEIQENISEALPKEGGGTPPQVSLGQSSLGKVSIGKDRIGLGREVQENFTEFLDSEKDLTDFMTTTLTKYMPRGPTQVMPIIQKLWLQATGKEMGGEVFQAVYSSLQKYPIPVLAKSLVKAVKYSEGKTKPAKYISTIFEKQMEDYERGRSP